MKAHRQQFLRMFCLRGLFCSAKDFYFVAVLLSAIFIFVKCKQCTVKEVSNQLEFNSCLSYKGNFDNSPDILYSDDNSESISRHFVPKSSPENIFLPSNSFCFPSKLTGFAANEVKPEPDASGVHSKVFSSGLKQIRSNLSSPRHHGIIGFVGGRVMSCSLYQQDGQTTDISKTFEFSSLNGVSIPPVEVQPSLLDWGPKRMCNPSIAFLTVKNVDADRVLIVYEPYSCSSQFYPCDFSEILLAPGKAASICFFFLPAHLGLSSAQLVLPTSYGGFLIQAKGFADESPYLIKPLSWLHISSNGRWRTNLSLFNPLDEALYVKEVTAWISTYSGNISRSSKSICRPHSMEDTMLSAKDWITVQRADVGRPEISLRPMENLEIDPLKTETIMESDVSGNFEGKLIAAFSMQLLRSSNNEIDTVMIPLEAELTPIPNTSAVGPISFSLEALVPCNTNGSVTVSLSVRNDASYRLRIIEVILVGERGENFQMKSIEGLTLFPKTITRVASINYTLLESDEANINCKVLVLMNDTKNSQMEIPCVDVISVCSGFLLESSIGYERAIGSVDYVNGGDRFRSMSLQPPSETKAVDASEADELILKSWKSQATENFTSVLDEKELLFPMVLVGNYSSKWISVKNPSQAPVVMQLILNSGEIIGNCKIPKMPSASSSILGGILSVAPTRYGFSIAKDALTEAFIHPYGTATFGSILFQPSDRCEWRSSALISNNLSGVEWLSLRGFGGSLSLVLLEEYNPIQIIEFKFSLHAMGGKSPSCPPPLTKEVYAKNTGDLPLEVTRVEVSGAKCGLHGFIVRNCTGFSLQPGESVKLHIMYQTDFSGPTVQRDLELAMASGILVIPMKASIPVRVLNLCKRSMFWMWVKKAVLVLLLAACLLCLLFSLLFPHLTAFESREFKTGEKSSSLFDKEPEMILASSVLSRSSSVENSEVQDTLDSQNWRVKVRKEKGRKRKKKKNCGAGGQLFEVSSSQSGNSTPSSPVSPAVEETNLFAQATLQQGHKSKITEPSSEVNFLDNGVVSRGGNSNWGSSAQDKPSAGRAIPPFLALTSTVAPHARAPGAKRGNPNNGGVVEKMGVEQKYIYDIWGDHLFGLPFCYQSKEVASGPSAIENNSESFFVSGPLTLMENYKLQPVIANLQGNE